MNTVGKLGSYISRSVYTVSAPFHPFGGAVDIVVVEQQDGSFKSSPWYVRFGKFQGVLKAKEKIVSINVNGVDAGFSMYLDNKGEAYFLRDVEMEVEESSNSVISSSSSSGEDTDGQCTTRRMPVKSTSVNYAGYESDSVTQIDISNVRVASRTNSRRSRIMGLVFGRKSVKQGLIEQDNDDAGVVVRRDSLDRAEIAADLLEVKWSTNLTSPRCSKKTGSGLSSQDVPKGNSREDKQIIDNSLINDAVVDNSMEVVKISPSSNVKDHSRHNFHMTSNRLAEETGIEMSALVPESNHEKLGAEDDGKAKFKESIKTGSLLVDVADGSTNTMHTISEVASAGIEIQDSMKHEFYPSEKCPNNLSFDEHEGSPDSCFFTDESEANGGPHLLSSETFPSSRSELDQSFSSSTQTIDLVCELNFESNSFLDEKEHSRIEDVLEKTDYFVFPDNVKNTESPRISSSSMHKEDANIQTKDLVCDMNIESESFLDEKEHLRVEDVLEKANYFVLPYNGKNTESPRISSNSLDKDVGSVHSIDLVCELNSESTSSRDENEPSKVEDVLEKTDYFVLPDNEKNTERPIISSNSIEKDVGKMQTIDLVCEVNSNSEHFLDEKTQPSVEDVLEKTDYFVLSDTGKNPESHRISSYSMPKDVISENYSQMNNLEPSYGSVEDEPQSIFTVSTFSNSTCQPLAEQSMREESEERSSEASLPPHLKIDQDLPNFFLAEVSEEERLLFGDIDDLKGIDSLEKNDPAVPLLCSSMYMPGSEILPSDAVDSRKELKTASSEVNIPETSVSQLGQGHKMAKSLPNMPIHDSDLDGHYSDSKLPNGEYDSKDANKMEQLKTGIGPVVGDSSRPSEGSDKSWRMWSFPFKKSRSFDVSQPPLSRNNSDSENIEDKNDQIEDENKPKGEENKGDKTKTKDTKKKIRVATPTSEQLASLNLKEGKNTVVFTFSTQMLGEQQVDARIFLWKWDTRIVISDVDGTITRSDLLGQVMPWVGVDWSQTGVTHLFSAIKENGYQLLFLSARAISQAYHTRQFLFNLKQDGKALPDGPVVISPDGLFPSLYREVVRRAPHEFKISCLEDIKALFPPDRNPFYAGFGNRDTDEFSYLKVGIPKGKIFIINPKGQIVVNRFVDTKSYTSFRTLVHDMFPSRTSFEQEDFNSWNFWKLPPPSIDV